uniref:BTB domain-containing protein n=1 Tax=Panagrolaimus davidi TaxID=227884 RepID=A0A914PID3_9BILA
MQRERYEIFKAQDQEKGHFDCAIEIGGKKIFIHKYFLVAASETFSVMFSDRWYGKNATELRIENPEYSYESFFEFLCFIYSGSCELTKENVFAITDMSEYYNIPFLKEECEEFLSCMDITVENIEFLVDFAYKYSFESFSAKLGEFIRYNFYDIVSSNEFIHYKKPFVQILSYCGKAGSAEEELVFAKIYEWATHKAIKNKTEDVEDVKSIIKAELNEFLPNVKFSKMGIEFLYEFAKIVVLEKQQTDIDLNDAIKEEISDFLPEIKFHQMSFEFLMDFVLEKEFYFSFVDLYKILATEDEEDAFRSVYKLAIKQAYMKQNSIPDPNFNLVSVIKNKLIGVFPIVKYSNMNYYFLLNFVVEKGFFLSTKDFQDLVNAYIFATTAEDTFKDIYELAVIQVLAKQKFSNDKNFEFKNAVKNELVEIFPLFDFSTMKRKFLMEFVVPNEVITEEEAHCMSDICIKIECDGKTITGIFKDVFGIINSLSSNGYINSSNAWNEHHLLKTRFKIPTIRSTVIQRKDIYWYLCLNNDGILTVKHQMLVTENDYIISQMKTESGQEFLFNRYKTVLLTTKYKDD